jgi:hypothetical protein
MWDETLWTLWTIRIAQPLHDIWLLLFIPYGNKCQETYFYVFNIIQWLLWSILTPVDSLRNTPAVAGAWSCHTVTIPDHHNIISSQWQKMFGNIVFWSGHYSKYPIVNSTCYLLLRKHSCYCRSLILSHSHNSGPSEHGQFPVTTNVGGHIFWR